MGKSLLFKWNPILMIFVPTLESRALAKRSGAPSFLKNVAPKARLS
jgi:hypothetical protein